MSVAAVVVTFNRKDVLRGCLRALQGQSAPVADVLVVDNASTDGTAAMVEAEFPGARVERLSENTGASGGFHAGVKAAFALGHERVWIMDDDAHPYPDALERLLEAAKLDGNEHAVLACRQVPEPGLPPADEGPRAIHDAMFVGMLVPREAIARIGFPRPEYFLYFDDIDYSRRLRQAGYRIVEVPRARIHHRDWSSMPTKSRKVLGRSVTRPVFPDWKAYYLTRNRILADRLNKDTAGTRSFLLKETPRDMIAYALLGQRRKAYFMLRGAWDGLRLRSGRRVQPGAK